MSRWLIRLKSLSLLIIIRFHHVNSFMFNKLKTFQKVSNQNCHIVLFLVSVPFMSCQVSLLHEHISMARTISTGHPCCWGSAEAQHDSSHLHIPPYKVSCPAASHDCFSELSYAENTHRAKNFLSTQNLLKIWELCSSLITSWGSFTSDADVRPTSPAIRLKVFITLT